MIPSPTSVVVVGMDDLQTMIGAAIERATRPFADRLAAATTPADVGPSAMLTAKEVAGFLRVNVRELRRLVREGRFPAPVKIGARAIRWRRDVVELAMKGGKS